jgi:hypothetical protein
MYLQILLVHSHFKYVKLVFLIESVMSTVHFNYLNTELYERVKLNLRIE